MPRRIRRSPHLSERDVAERARGRVLLAACAWLAVTSAVALAASPSPAPSRTRPEWRPPPTGGAHIVLASLSNAAGTGAAARGDAPLSARAGVPARIVSTSPSVTETLFALGLGDRVVGVSSYCRFPAEVAKLPKVGTFLKPNAETIARLTPDLVFLHTGPHAAAAQLAALGVKTATVDRGTLPSVFTSIREIGAAAGVPDRADRLVIDLRASLDRIKASVAGRPPRKVLIVIGRRTGTLTDLIAVGPDSYLHDVAAIAGGTNVLASVKVAYPRISMETVISLAPDVIIDIGEMGESPADSDRRRRVTEGLWQRQPMVKAVRDGGVHASNDEAFVVPGPRLVDIAKTMAHWFHGVGTSGPSASAARQAGGHETPRASGGANVAVTSTARHESDRPSDAAARQRCGEVCR